MRIFAVRSCFLAVAVCLTIILTSGAAAPPAPKMTDQQHGICCFDAGAHIVKASAVAASAEFSLRSHRFGLNPAQNEHGADVLLVGVATITSKSGNKFKQIWAVYCADSEVVSAVNLSLGNIQ